MHKTQQLWSRTILSGDSTIGCAIHNLDKNAVKIVLITNKDGVLEGTVSDGDIRRGLLKGLDMNSPISSIVHRNALVVPPDLGRDLVIQLMVANKIQQIPVVDENHCVVGLHLWDEITTPPQYEKT